MDGIQRNTPVEIVSQSLAVETIDHHSTPFAVHYEKIRIYLRKTATNRAKIHSLARKSEHLRINQIQ